MAYDIDGRMGRRVEISTLGEKALAFVPPFLPPEPAIDLSRLAKPLEAATLALGRLDSAAGLLPDRALFLYNYVVKEALLSSQIEGTQSSLSELILFEENEIAQDDIDDLKETSNYIRAIAYGVERIAGGFPLSLRLMREIHAKLLNSGRGRNAEPGEFRRVPVWIGGTKASNAVFVPPPPGHILDLMSDLERFIHDEEDGLPVLVKAGLIHVQFETIHPFIDGNGRLGRLLIPLFLISHKVLQEPVLYLSLFLKSHRSLYYQHLQDVRDKGDWEAWLEFFLEGVAHTADQAAQTANQLQSLFTQDREKIKGLGRAASSILTIHELLTKRPVATIKYAVQQSGLSKVTVGKAFHKLQELGIVIEISQRNWGQTFSYHSFFNIMREGTDPL